MVIRAFVAIEMPIEIQRGLTEAISNLQTEFKGLPIRWIPIDSVHLTLKFLGELQEGDINSISQALGEQLKEFGRFDVSIGGIGVFPDASKPNVLWIGLESNDQLNKLQNAVEAALIPFGYPREARWFSPHITLARVKRGAGYSDLRRIGELATAVRPAIKAAGRVDAVTLLRSELKPSGAVYNALSHVPLAVK
jgi:RNA 2',3'-cyclic 3'-phosphodiesterase